jgi:hypothetical protein
MAPRTDNFVGDDLVIQAGDSEWPFFHVHTFVDCFLTANIELLIQN